MFQIKTVAGKADCVKFQGPMTIWSVQKQFLYMYNKNAQNKTNIIFKKAILCQLPSILDVNEDIWSEQQRITPFCSKRADLTNTKHMSQWQIVKP